MKIEGWMVSPIGDINNWPLPVSGLTTLAIFQTVLRTVKDAAPPAYHPSHPALWGRVLYEYAALQEALGQAVIEINELRTRVRELEER